MRLVSKAVKWVILTTEACSFRPIPLLQRAWFTSCLQSDEHERWICSLGDKYLDLSTATGMGIPGIFTDIQFLSEPLGWKFTRIIVAHVKKNWEEVID
jgi:hypothetical protein